MKTNDPHLAAGYDRGRALGYAGESLQSFAEAYASALRGAVTAEKERVRRILAHPVPTPLCAMRQQLAFGTSVPADEAIKALRVATVAAGPEMIADDIYAERRRATRARDTART